MSVTGIPRSPAELNAWCKQHGIPAHEARVRLSGLIVLACIASNPRLNGAISFKGGNALRFFYQSPRSTLDLDFSATGPDIPDDADELRIVVDAALSRSQSLFNMKTKCQKIERKPKANPHRTHPTYSINVGYQFEWDPYYHNFDTKNVSDVTYLEISLADIVCEFAQKPLPLGGLLLNVCSLDDIAAEKLRSLLQQPIRNRHRSQDVYDLSLIYRNHRHDLDFPQIRDFLIKKARPRGIEPLASSFDGVIREMAKLEYEERIKQQSKDNYIPFEAAWSDVMGMVATLELPP